MSRFSDTLRIELLAFGIRVVELKTGGVKTNIINTNQAAGRRLPENSIFAPAREETEKAMQLGWADGIGITTELWAKQVVADILRKSPPAVIFRGESAWVGWLGTLFSFGTYDYLFRQMTGLSKIDAIIRKQ